MEGWCTAVCSMWWYPLLTGGHHRSSPNYTSLSSNLVNGSTLKARNNGTEVIVVKKWDKPGLGSHLQHL